MFTVQELAERVAAYRSERISLAQFEDWFEANSAGAYDVPELSEQCVSVDAALSQFYFDHTGENVLRLELAKAVRPLSSEFSGIAIRFLPDPLATPVWDVPYNLYLDYPSQQYSLFARADIPLPWVPPYGTSSAVSEAALPSQRIESAASVTRPVQLEGVAA